MTPAGHRTRVSLSVTAAAAGLDAAAAGAGEHRVSVRFLPPDAAQQATGAPANYLASEEPSGDSEAPWAPVQVAPDPAIAPVPKLAKRAENLTHPNGPTQPGDRIRYTIEASNGAKGSLWTDVVVTDPLPACLELDEVLALPQNQPNAPLYPAGGAPGSRPGALPHFGRPRYLGPPPRARSTAG